MWHACYKYSTAIINKVVAFVLFDVHRVLHNKDKAIDYYLLSFAIV